MTVEVGENAAAMVVVERRGAVAYLKINRPGASNAATPASMRQLCMALDEAIEDDSVCAIVLGHVGKHFIAGADFGFLERLTETSTADVRREIYEYFQGAAKRIHLCPKPTVAAVGGAAITVGCELATACDFRIVTPAAMFQQSWLRVGLIPPLGGLKLLPSLVGYGVAKDMILRGRQVRGEEAVALGLATTMVAPEELESAAYAFATELSVVAPMAYGAAKEGLRRGLESSFDESWAANLLAQSLLIGSADFREGVTAVREQRKPVFKGR